MAESFVKPGDVGLKDAQRILAFINKAKSAEEIAEAVGRGDERGVGLAVAQNLLDKRQELGGFGTLEQVADVPQVGRERFAEIVTSLGSGRTGGDFSRLVPKLQGFRRTALEYVDGMGGAVDVLSYKDGADATVRMRPGESTWSSITVRRSRVGPPILWSWWKETLDGVERRLEVELSLLDRTGKTVAVWTLHGCWPSHWRLVHKVGEGSGETGYVEQLTLVVENVDLD